MGEDDEKAETRVPGPDNDVSGKTAWSKPKLQRLGVNLTVGGKGFAIQEGTPYMGGPS